MCEAGSVKRVTVNATVVDSISTRGEGMYSTQNIMLPEFGRKIEEQNVLKLRP